MTIEKTKQIFKGKLDNNSHSEILEFITRWGLICDSLLDISVGSLTIKENSANTKAHIKK